MTACCPLSGCDEYATVYNTSVRVARKEHRCYECRDPIPRGATYEYISMLFDGCWDDFKLCLLCKEIGDHFTCESGRVLGEMWNELEEYFFPDMKCGGQCMEGLSPEAKRRLIDKRMEWYFDQDECRDGQWDGWTPDKPPSPPRPEPEPREYSDLDRYNDGWR